MLDKPDYDKPSTPSDAKKYRTSYVQVVHIKLFPGDSFNGSEEVAYMHTKDAFNRKAKIQHIPFRRPVQTKIKHFDVTRFACNDARRSAHAQPDGAPIMLHLRKKTHGKMLRPG